MNSNWCYSPKTAKLGGDLCDLDLWPWPIAWTSLLSLVITPEKFMKRWWEHSQKGVTDGRTDRQTDWTIHRAAWSQLKTISSFVHHFVAIGDFKLEIWCGTAQFGSKSTIFRADRPCNSTYDLEKQWGTSSILLQALCIISEPLVNSNLSYCPETPNLGQIRQFLEPCDLAFWCMTLKNNRAPSLCYFKLYALLNSNWSYSPETDNLGQNRQFF